jgi:hypothetical protein
MLPVDISPEDAWNRLEQADEQKEVEDIKKVQLQSHGGHVCSLLTILPRLFLLTRARFPS